jgi:hypothetical protein
MKLLRRNIIMENKQNNKNKSNKNNKNSKKDNQQDIEADRYFEF